MMQPEKQQNVDNEQDEKNELIESIQINNLLSSDILQTENNPKKEKLRLKPKEDFNFLNQKNTEKLLQVIKNPKHQTAILLMMDCGLRVTECVTLQIKNFDFKRKLLNVKSLKKKGENSIRQIPISNRLTDALAEYISILKPTNEEDYLFPGNGDRKHISRKSLNRLCERIKKENPSIGRLHPHALRHTFATQMLANGAKLFDVKTLLGHTSFNTTLIYNHTPIEILRKNIFDATEQKNQSWLKKLYQKLFKKKAGASIINISNHQQNFIVGRENEIAEILEALNKNINTILIGKIGVGKTHLLKQIDFPKRKVLKIDEMTNLKLTFVNMLLYLYNNDKEHVKNLIFGEFNQQQIQQKLQRDSVATLVDEIIKITAKHEYILMIDNVDGITAKSMKCIEQLKDHFVIITTAREVPINKANFLWNFERIEIKPLKREPALELIHKLSYDLEIEDYPLYRNHIYDQSSGNPRVIFELCERYRKELIITDDVIRSVRHIGGIPEIDMSFIVVFILAAISVLRYTNREIGGENLRFIGGIALVSLVLVRYFLSRTKRKFI